MSSRAIAVSIAVVVAGGVGVAIAIAFANQQSAEGRVNVLLDQAGAPRRASGSARNEVPVGAQQAMRYLENEYTLAVYAVNAARIRETVAAIRALQRRYPGLHSTIPGI